MQLQQLLQSFFFYLFTLLSYSLVAQDCAAPDPDNGSFIYANNIKAYYLAAGSSFFDGDDAQFTIDDPLISVPAPIATIFAHGLWMGGFDASDNLMLSASEYGISNGMSDYYPGPLMDDGSVLNSTCANFDHVWSVYRYEIELHQADFADNGVIDNPLDAVIGWPARGNEQFESVNGFPLADNNTGYANFADLNNNGLYEPMLGEYPRISQSDSAPDQILWMVFNTRGNLSHETDSPFQLSTEIQLTAWAFNCTDSPILNHSTFASYKIVNKSAESIRDFRVAFWTDFDLGCHTDDFVGCAPLQNTYFAYNQDNDDDEVCASAIVGAGENPPVQSVSFLNQSLDYFSHYSNDAFSPGPPFGPTDAQSYYAIMDGLFFDGTPITPGGNGYNPTSTEEAVNHTFPDDPNDPDGWSEHSAAITGGDRRAMGSTIVDELLPGGIYTIDLAYAYHREDGADYIGNVSSMYSNVADIQAAYENGFSTACTLATTCEEDCIWPGDLNNDGIANHEDLISLGFELNSNGPTREGPYNWFPRTGESWLDTQIFGADKKHLDANGDGIADENDFDLTSDHYNLTQPGYEPVYDFPEGDDIIIERIGSMPDFINMTPGASTLARIKLETEVADLRGIAFTAVHDPNYLTVNPIGGGISFNFFSEDNVDHFDFSAYETEEDSTIPTGTMLLIQIVINGNFPEPLPTDETFICFRNIRAYLSDGTPVELGAQKVMIQIDGITTNTKEPDWAQAINVFPSPTADILQLQTANTVLSKIELFDSQGRILTTFANTPHQVDVSRLPAGLYYLRLFSEGDFVLRKFVKM